MSDIQVTTIPVVPLCCRLALQTQEFYDFCDEHGIMVWQDAMFGGSHYPRNPEWIANIEEEITQQVRLHTLHYVTVHYMLHSTRRSCSRCGGNARQPAS
jgi:hypothetical protein